MGLIERLQEKPQHVKSSVSFFIAIAGTALVAFVWVTALPARLSPLDAGGQAASPAAAVDAGPIRPTAAEGTVTLPLAPGPAVGGDRPAPAAPQGATGTRPVQVQVATTTNPR